MKLVGAFVMRIEVLKNRVSEEDNNVYHNIINELIECLQTGKDFE